MPPNLHPRSRLTSSLFATTLLASFLVVGIPHIIPCPSPRVAYADGEMTGDGTQRRRRRRKCPQGDASSAEGVIDAKKSIGVFTDDQDIPEDGRWEGRMRRECPIPKPGGIIGETLGFTNAQSRRKAGPDSRKPP